MDVDDDVDNDDDDDDGVFLACEDFWENVAPFLACAFFFQVEISSSTLIPLFMPGSVHSGSTTETTVAECFLTSCV